FFVFLLPRRPPLSRLFPYTTLFRSKRRRSSLVVRRSRESAGIISEHQSNNLQDTIRRRDVRGQPLDQRQSLVSYARCGDAPAGVDRKSTRLNSSHLGSSYAVFCLKK